MKEYVDLYVYFFLYGYVKKTKTYIHIPQVQLTFTLAEHVFKYFFFFTGY